MKAPWNIEALLWATATALVARDVDPLPHQPCTGDYCYDISPLEPRFFPSLEPQRLQIKYGPFTTPPTHEHNGHHKTYFRTNPPCYDCYLTAVKADLQYPNGTTANTNTGLWLHHVVITNLVQSSITCPEGAEIIFASGNERTEVKISLDGTVPAGYYINPHDLLLLFPELMNTAHVPQDAIIVIDYEFVPLSDLSVEAGFKKVTPVWLDVDGPCSPNAGAIPVPAGVVGEKFTLEMEPKWKSDISGDVLFVMGHVRDGATGLEVVRSSSDGAGIEGGETVCNGEVRYGEEEGDVDIAGEDHGHGRGDGGDVDGGHGGRLEKRRFWRSRGKGKGKGKGHDDDHDDHDDEEEEVPTSPRRQGVHVSSISTCTLPGRIEKGEEWTVRANYDFAKHAPMVHGGELAPVMGMSLMYVVEDGQ
ncbi:hypothetical protein B0T21DRAFT_381975 [Apiosordaria backusii]|uniref:Uncharacterized protein n=1 Tax=Apiosordaria backusii TaxID=314023 RepID=A0AA40EN18_9PEZI|nr:hypothetical protein B0T21DRAFT_381975 [Apiosordaria backusii]